MKIIHPLTPDQWITKMLRADATVRERVEDRIWGDDDVDLAAWKDEPGGGWPYIVYSIIPQGVDLVHEKRPFMGVVLAQVRAVMRKDKLPPGVKGNKSFLAPATEDGGLVGHLIRALSGVKDPEVATGMVWSSIYEDQYRHSYLDGNVDVLELGGKFRIRSTPK